MISIYVFLYTQLFFPETNIAPEHVPSLIHSLAIIQSLHLRVDWNDCLDVGIIFSLSFVAMFPFDTPCTMSGHGYGSIE